MQDPFIFFSVHEYFGGFFFWKRGKLSLLLCFLHFVWNQITNVKILLI